MICTQFSKHLNKLSTLDLRTAKGIGSLNEYADADNYKTRRYS